MLNRRERLEINAPPRHRGSITYSKGTIKNVELMYMKKGPLCLLAEGLESLWLSIKTFIALIRKKH
jgi:hypothetical protein